ncbi:MULTISPECIES: MmgE/PrpD family protein [unclassified Achromobacter]|uniref:MmgE/PrpD family protein n=1 Tax=unclassified Achromobacter TaxID=2626865 RepID=UPI000B51C209|nr:MULTISPECIES: MmgE/PrpD family protein [unclassified Achromobacter]OWT79885.1 2-methylcitrate dehydratase [Achromobacter sp. HZ34]OWT81769.1 2-methylcitrate dehydratase [Achromobacter sp. HZ28]
MSSSQPPLLENATRDLARFAAALRYDDLPPEVVARIKSSVLDSIGCCLFGATLPWTGHVQAMVQEEGATPVASLFGYGGKTSVSQAVLVNATAGHAFELDDIHKESIVHPGSIALPVALALAERAGGWSGRDLITAMAAGYEIGTRVGNAATMRLFFRGFHPQGSSGVFVGAATAGRALGLDAGRMQHALGIAGSQAGGLMAAQEGAMVKRFHSGRAAQSGVYSALLAQRDFTGITDVLEASYGGYLSTYSGEPNAARLTDGLGEVWETAKIGYKPHASVTSIHAALDALAQLMRENDLGPDDIEHVDVGVSHMTFVHCAWDYKAQGVTAAQMNLYYGLAVIAHDGMAFVSQYREDRLADPRLLDFITRIHAREEARFDSMGPAFRHAAVVTLRTRDGRQLTHEILNRRGSPENPISADDVEYKFRNVVESCLAPADIDKVVKWSADLERLADLQALLQLLAARRPSA